MWSATCPNVFTRDLLSDKDNVIPDIMVLLFSITIGGDTPFYVFHSFITLGKIREDPLFPTFRALRALRGLKFPCHFWTAGIKTFRLVYTRERQNT